MASNAYTEYLEALLADAAELSDAHRRLRTGLPGRQWGLGAVNRAAVVLCVSAWEAYVEEIAKEALEAMRPAGVATGAWTALRAPAFAQIKRFNTPDSGNTKQLFASCLGVADITTTWGWRNCTAQNAREYLDYAIGERHKIAHGVNPRPTIHNSYSGWLPSFFRNLGRCTDRGLKAHVSNLGGQPTW
jgi:hypothetical protein